MSEIEMAFESNTQRRRAVEKAKDKAAAEEKMAKLMHQRMIIWCLNVGTGCATAIAGVNIAMGNWKMGLIGFAIVAAVTVYGYFLDKRYTEDVINGG